MNCWRHCEIIDYENVIFEKDEIARLMRIDYDNEIKNIHFDWSKYYSTFTIDDNVNEYVAADVNEPIGEELSDVQIRDIVYKKDTLEKEDTIDEDEISIETSIETIVTHKDAQKAVNVLFSYLDLNNKLDNIKNRQNINYLQDVIDSIRDLNITQQKLDKFFIKN